MYLAIYYLFTMQGPNYKGNNKKFWTENLLHIIKGLPKDPFDDVVQIATFTFNKPMATISILYQDQHWLKSKVGLPDFEDSQILSLCSCTVQGAEPFIIRDILEDTPINEQLKMASVLPIRFYAGVPLTSADEGIFGTLDIFDYVPGDLTSEQVKILQALARQVATVFKLKIREKEFLQSEKRYKDLIETSNDLIWSVDTKGRFTFINEAIKRTHGYEPEEVLGRPFTDFEPPEQVPIDLKTFELIKAGEPFFEYETVHLRKDGTVVHLVFNAIVLVDENGNVLGTTGTARDITKQKLAETALKESEARFRYISESNMIGILFWNLEGDIKEANDALLEMIGYTREEILSGKVRWVDMTPSEYYPFEQKALAEIADKGVCTPFEKEYIRKDGSRISILIGGALHDWPHGTGVCFVIDISQRKKVEQELKDNEERLRLAFDIAGIGTFEWNIQSNQVTRSDSLKQLHPILLDNINSNFESFLEIIYPPDRELVKNSLIKAMEESESVISLEYRISLPDGNIHWVGEKGRIYYDDKGAPIRMIGVVMDISERKLSEQLKQKAHEELEKRVQERTAELTHINQALLESEVRFRQLAENINEVFWIRELDQNKILYVSPAYEQIWGRSCESLYNDPYSFLENVLPEDQKRLLEEINFISQGQPYHGEYRIKHPNGTVRWLETRSFPIRDKNGNVYRAGGITEDITERKLAVEALRNFADNLTKAQEEERRRISRQLHDDAGQTLTAIAVRLSLIERQLQNKKHIEPSIYEDLNDLQIRLQLVQQNLRSLAHTLHPSVLEHFGLTHALGSHLETLCAKSGVKSHIEADPEFPRFNSTVETVIYRIMQEAILNALKHAHAEKLFLRLKKMENSVIVELEDDGCGFDIISSSSPTGIGIISMRERADIIGSKLEIQSLKGKGTRLTLTIPAGLNI
jgi:PAS domain S-box-containing protein